MIPAAATIVRETRAEIRVVVPDNPLRDIAQSYLPQGFPAELQVGRLDDALSQATLALASTGTVTLECAWFGVPTVAMYKTSPLTYQVGRRIITVPYFAMPNLMAQDRLIPELIQHEATHEALASNALELLRDPRRRDAIRSRLLDIARSLGTPGASQRAARAIRDQLAVAAGAL
jgi:lipid-A-disaccharide synthase